MWSIFKDSYVFQVARIKAITAILAENAKKPPEKIRFLFRKIRRAIKVKYNRFTFKITKIYLTIIGWIRAYKAEIVVFTHITLGVVFIIWGLEVIFSAALGWTVWRILVGTYVLLWVGLVYLKKLFITGLYLGE